MYSRVSFLLAPREHTICTNTHEFRGERKTDNAALLHAPPHNTRRGEKNWFCLALQLYNFAFSLTWNAYDIGAQRTNTHTQQS